MSFDIFLQPRQEVLNNTIEGIVDLANLKEHGSLESEPGRFFGITYPTYDITRVIQALDTRFSAAQPNTPGLYLFEGLKGSGKSHLLLLVYHLFEHRDEAETWLANHNLICRLPRDVTVIVNKFTDRPFGSSWDLIYRCLTGQDRNQAIIQPGLEEMQQLVGDRRLVLIWDELERGIQSISDSAVQAQNLSFLQMLSEWANRSTQITLLTSIYSDVVEPGSTLKRVSPVRVQFQHAPDRARVVLYRLFENYLTFDSRTVRSIVDSYINIWRRHIAFNADEYTAQMLEAYPFSPDLLTLFLERAPTRGDFQNIRGALGFLAHLIRLNRGRANLITPGLSPMTDREVALRLSDLDLNQLVHRARSNLEDLKALSPAPPLINEISSATLLYTLTGTGRNVGASREALIRSAMQSGSNINDFERTLLAMQRYAANFHVVEGRYFFDQEETPDAKVELRALVIQDTMARSELRKIQQDLFNSPNVIVFTAVPDTQESLATLDSTALRYVLAPRTLSPEERHALYYGLPLRNQVILLEPGERTFNLNENPDLLKWATRYLAADELMGLSQADARRAYEKIKGNEHRQITNYLKRIGLRYVRFEVYGSSAVEDEVDEEPLGRAITGEQVGKMLSSQFYPSELIMEHLRDRLDELIGRTVREIEQEYKATLGFPVPAKVPSLTDAIRDLCADDRGLISLHHPTRGRSFKERPQLSHPELLAAIIESPLDTPAPPSVRPATALSGQDVGPYPSITTEPVAPAEPGDVDDTPASVWRPPDEVRILPQTSPGLLRQEIAFQLQDRDQAQISQVRFTIFVEQSRTDLGRFSGGLRGSLTGEGDISADIILTFKGDYDKATIEQMVEQLPIIPGAEYQATITILAEQQS